MTNISLNLEEFDSLKIKLIKSIDYYINKLVGYNRRNNIKNLFSSSKSKNEIINLLKRYFVESMEEKNKISLPLISPNFISFEFTSIGISANKNNDYEINTVIDLYDDKDGFICYCKGELKWTDCTDYHNTIQVNRRILFKC